MADICQKFIVGFKLLVDGPGPDGISAEAGLDAQRRLALAGEGAVVGGGEFLVSAACE